MGVFISSFVCNERLFGLKLYPRDDDRIEVIRENQCVLTFTACSEILQNDKCIGHIIQIPHENKPHTLGYYLLSDGEKIDVNVQANNSEAYIDAEVIIVRHLCQRKVISC